MIQYSNVHIAGFGYELAPNVVDSQDLEERLAPLYNRLHLKKGQLEAITGIYERRFWDPGMKMWEGAAAAGKKALESTGVRPSEIGVLIYGGVCRDNLEPATACAVAHELSLSPDTQIFDLSNACLGALNGMIQIANAIELGQIQAGMVVACESARAIVELTIERLLQTRDMALFKDAIATLTGGSGAVAVILTAAELSPGGHPLLGGVVKNASEFHGLCLWGPDAGRPVDGQEVMKTDSVGVLKNGVALGIRTYEAFKAQMGWQAPDKVICHQVGAAHQKTILDSVGIGLEKDFPTYPYLGNIGSVSLPITAAIAHEREFLQKADQVGFFGIGSGLNCMMLGVRW